jgi:hypothetical protein
VLPIGAGVSQVRASGWVRAFPDGLRRGGFGAAAVGCYEGGFWRSWGRPGIREGAHWGPGPPGRLMQAGIKRSRQWLTGGLGTAAQKEPVFIRGCEGRPAKGPCHQSPVAAGQSHRLATRAAAVATAAGWSQVVAVA